MGCEVFFRVERNSGGIVRAKKMTTSSGFFEFPCLGDILEAKLLGGPG